MFSDNTISGFLNQILESPHQQEPDIRRRARLLNILLLSVFILTLLVIVALLAGAVTETFTLLTASLIAILFIGIIYGLNQYGYTTIAGWLFLGLLTAIFAFFDTPAEVVGGRTLFLFAIPILMASVILKPFTSFIMAVGTNLLLLWIAINANLELNIAVIGGFLVFAVVAWLSANTLENALGELRIINQDLDKRVEARTAELKITNTLLEEQIVERQRAAEVARIARDQALEASRFKTELLAKVSHELRTPLGVILGFAEMMDAGIYGPVTEKQKDVLTKIIERDRRLNQLVGDLLDQSQFDSSKIKLQHSPFSPAKIVDNVYISLKDLAEKSNVDLIVNLDSNLPEALMGDGNRIEQIITNLVNNALKFTEKGYVRLNIRVMNDQEWTIQVEDTGLGIPDKAQRYIFEAFRQVDGSATRHHAGFGLGLSIVKQLTDAMNGKIELVSEIGKGSSFTITLPMIPAKLQEKIYE